MGHKVAVYPGTFDPVTNGHLDLIKRCLEIFDRVIVAVAHSPKKNPLFSVEERVEFIKEATHSWKNIEVNSFDCLLVDFVDRCGGDVIVKGLRAVSDFEYELQLSLMNRRLANKIESIFMMPSEEFSFLSSKVIKEVVNLGGDVKGMVTPAVMEGLKRKFEI